MARKLDVVFVNPGGRKRVYQGLAAELAAVEPPVWAGLMAEHARRRGLSVSIVDADALELDAAEVAREVADRDPVLTAVVVYGHQPSASTQNMPAAGAICRAIRELEGDRRVLLVGGHAAALPERTLAEEFADFVCTGEGPLTIADLVAALRAGDGLGAVPDLCFRSADGTVQRTSAAPLIRDLDHDMPGLAWDLLPLERYRAHNWHCFGHLERQPYAALYTTLGCPYKCTFCCIQAPFKAGEKLAGFKETVNSYRMWSVDAVMAQIDWLVQKHGVRNIKIADEMFVLNPRHVLGICDAVAARGYDLNFWAYARVDTVRDEMVDRLMRGGVRWLAFGIEAANAKVRDDVSKGYAQEDIFATLDKVRRAGVNVIANYVFGLPEDDLASMQETLDLALEVNAEFANFYCAMAYPGSGLYRQALEQGWKLPATWAGYSQHAYDSQPLPTRHLSAAEVLRFRDAAFQRYFTDTRYLEMIERRFGTDTVHHIQAMAAVPLPRANA